ncbi:MAG: ROK family protein [Bryobacteraceae bacterium]|nr:ROK family protein [Bryobacteraceae bacterium]
MKIAEQWFRDVLGLLYQRRTATRKEIIHSTGLNPACVSLTIQHLLKSGTVQCVGELRSSGGRNREVLKLRPDAGYFVVVDLAGTRVRVGLADFLGDISYRWEEEISFSRPFDIRRIAKGVEMIRQSMGDGERSRVLAAGVSYTGLMDDAGRVTAVNLGWKDYPLRQGLEPSLEMPVFYGNDGHCTILAEHWVGVAENYTNCVYILAGLGIGIGCFVDGHLLRGNDGMAGEFGHLTIDASAPDRCNCGKNGCLEAIASSPNIVRQYLERSGRQGEDPQSYPVTKVFALAREGDSAALAVMDRAGRALGFGLSHLVNILNPQLIVLGGDLIYGQDLLLAHIGEELARHCAAKLREHLVLRVSSLGHDSGLKGAASLAFLNSFEDGALLRRMTNPDVIEDSEEESTETAVVLTAK